MNMVISTHELLRLDVLGWIFNLRFWRRWS